MPETPQPIDIMESLDRDEPIDSPNVNDQVEQGQEQLMTDAQHTIGQTMQINANVEMNEALQLKGMESLLRYVNARAAMETRGLEGLANKFSVRGKIGNIFKLKLQQEISAKFDPESIAKGETAQLYKTKAEIKMTPGIILGVEEYQGRDKVKPYFGYQLNGGKLNVAFLGEYEMEEGETEINARMKASYKIAEDMNLFADITLSAINQPDQLGIDQLQGCIGLNLPQNQAIVLAGNVGKQEAFLTYVGRF